MLTKEKLAMLCIIVLLICGIVSTIFAFTETTSITGSRLDIEQLIFGSFGIGQIAIGITLLIMFICWREKQQ
jgi:Na+/glutamate symporter